MKILEVSPITNKVAKEALTYYSSKEVNVGDIVSVPLRNKFYKAIVLNVTDIKNEKLNIRKANFIFKKIKSIEGKSPFYDSFFETITKTKDFFIGNSGQMINFFIPNFFLENLEKLNSPHKFDQNKQSGEISLLINNLENRIDFYKKYFENIKKHNKSLLFIVPTKEEVDFFYDLLKNENININKLSNKLSKKNLVIKYNNIVNSKDSQIIITTPSFVFIPIHNLQSIVLENESWSGYRTLKRPYFDIKVFIKNLAKKENLDLIFAGDTVTVENSIIKKNKESNTKDFLNMPEIIDMTHKENLYKKSFIISKEFKKILENGGKNFIFVLRKGLASQIICHDCKHVLKKDDEPLSLIEKNGERFFKSSHTKKIFDSKIRCEVCGGWNFDTIGIGIDTVFTEIKKEFPNLNILKIDKDSTKNIKELKNVYKKFLEDKNTLLLGTEMVIPYLKDKIDNSIIVSLDSLLFIPSFKVNEKIVRLISDLSKISKNKTLIQTRQKIDHVLESLEKNDLQNFYEKELEKRRTYNYPPFSTIIKVIRKEKSKDSKDIERLLENTKKWNPIKKNIKRIGYFENIILFKIPVKDWNEDHQNLDLKALLSSLGPDFEIRVNPEALF